MSLSQRMDIRQSQNLALSMSMQQSLQILAASNLDLQNIISSELEQNPVIELDGPKDKEIDYDNENNNFADTYDTELFDNILGDRLNYQVRSRNNDYNDNYDSYIEQIESNAKTLRDHITQQINIDLNNHSDRIVAIKLIDYLDDSGFFNGDKESIATQLKCNIEKIDDVLDRLQYFDPPGIFACNLKQSMKNQLKERNRFDPIIEQFIDHIDLYLDTKFPKLAKLCSCDIDELHDMFKEIRTLNPKPAASFIMENAMDVVVDVYVRSLNSGGFQIELNNNAFPRLLFNKKYISIIEGGIKTKDEKKYLTERVNSANHLIRAIEQRANTILKVSSFIVEYQKDFFNNGIEYLKPMTMSFVASEIGMHESTISRVANNKYLSSDLGVFELKYFFTSNITSISNNSDDLSSRSVQHYIKELIKAEEANNILSDDKIAEILKDKNINIARRTVAKYREAMNIASSSIRRKQRRRQSCL